jgi:hypothetical protein
MKKYPILLSILFLFGCDNPGEQTETKVNSKDESDGSEEISSFERSDPHSLEHALHIQSYKATFFLNKQGNRFGFQLLFYDKGKLIKTTEKGTFVPPESIAFGKGVFTFRIIDHSKTSISSKYNNGFSIPCAFTRHYEGGSSSVGVGEGGGEYFSETEFSALGKNWVWSGLFSEFNEVDDSIPVFYIIQPQDRFSSHSRLNSMDELLKEWPNASLIVGKVIIKTDPTKPE